METLVRRREILPFPSIAGRESKPFKEFAREVGSEKLLLPFPRDEHRGRPSVGKVRRNETRSGLARTERHRRIVENRSPSRPWF